VGVTSLLLDTHALLWALLDPDMIESLPLVTADAALSSLPGLRIVW
jgi:PIN domain nuclease of toxin-antitoxin system